MVEWYQGEIIHVLRCFWRSSYHSKPTWQNTGSYLNVLFFSLIIIKHLTRYNNLDTLFSKISLKNYNLHLYCWRGFI